VARREAIEIEVGGRAVRVSSPNKIYFPAIGLTKKGLIDYYLAVGDGALRGIHQRPIVLKRYVNGIEGDFFFQKRAPKNRPEWLETVELRFPSGRQADELVVTELAQLVWMVNLGNIDLNPHPVRAGDLDHPDELRIDLDPSPGVDFAEVQEVALVVREVLEEHGLMPFPKTSGSRGIHVYARIEPRWSFSEVRAAALSVAREVERRAPERATSKWWKEERHGVFLDYNQNAKDRTVASAYSVRPRPTATVSAPLRWDEVPGCAIEDFTALTMPARFAELGDLHAAMDDSPGSLEPLLELSARQAEQGLGEAPYPPHYRKAAGEPPRAAPSRRRTSKPRAEAPLVIVARADDEADARAGLERWRERHPEAARHLEPADILIDAMRGRSTTWTRIRVNLRHVPEALRPGAEPPDPDLPPGDWRLPKSETGAGPSSDR
jgi:DNA ligase D-like protein (predicted polymerase)